MNPRNISVSAFALCTYIFLFTTFTLVQREGKGIWLIFTLPIHPADYFFKKIKVWATFSYFFFIVVYSLYFLWGGVVNFELVSNFLIVLLGISIYAYISTGIGILGYDPNIVNQAHKTSQFYAYLYFYLCGFYTSSFFTENLYLKLNIIVLSFTIAISIKSKVKSTLRYFLDKNDSDNQLTIFEAVLFIFFYISLLTTIQIVLMSIGNQHQYLFLSGCIATSLIGGVLIYCSRSFKEIKNIGQEIFRFYKYQILSLQSILYIILSISIAIAYLGIIHHLNLFGTDTQNVDEPSTQFILFAVLIAPLIEEILFRRILFKTMLNTLTPLAAILYSSLLFALAHPPSSFIPVFFVGCLSANLYLRTKNIHQSIFLHAFYNAAIIMIQS